MDRKVALITGGARRIGRAIALRLAQNNFDVAITFLRSDLEAASLVHDVQALRGRAIAIRADLARAEESALLIFNEVRQQFGRIDLIVNNASIYKVSSLPDATPELRRDLWAVHVEAPFLLARHFAPLLRENKGRIINMLDLLSERPWPAYLYYCLTKAALQNLTLGLARELAPEVTVNGISPGVVEWPQDYAESDREKYLKRVPLGHVGSPEDAADLVLFLATRAAYMTGQVVYLDGGRSIT